MAVQVTGRALDVKDFPTSPIDPSQVTYVTGEIQPIPVRGVKGGSTPVENSNDPINYVIPQYHVVCAWTDPYASNLKRRLWARSEKARREGDVPYVFANANGLNFTGRGGEKLAKKYKLRFFGIAHDGSQDGSLARAEPVAAGRLSVIQSGQVTVYNHLKYMREAVPGDFIEIVFVDSGGRWTGESDEFHTFVLRVANVDEGIRTILNGSSGYATPAITGGGTNGNVSITSLAATSVLFDKVSTEPQEHELVVAAMVAWKMKQHLYRAISSEYDFTKRLEALGIPGDVIAFLVGSKFHKKRIVGDDGRINPLGMLDFKADDTLVMYGLPGKPSLMGNAVRVLNASDEGTDWLIPSTESIYARVHYMDEADKPRAIARLERIPHAKGAIEEKQLAYDSTVHKFVQVKISCEITFGTFLDQVQKPNSDVDFGASIDSVNRALEPICWLCRATHSSGSHIYTKEDEVLEKIFPEVHDKFSAPEKTVLRDALTNFTGIDLNVLLAALEQHCGGRPIYFDHPLTRLWKGLPSWTGPRQLAVQWNRITIGWDQYIGTETKDVNFDFFKWHGPVLSQEEFASQIGNYHPFKDAELEVPVEETPELTEIDDTVFSEIPEGTYAKMTGSSRDASYVADAILSSISTGDRHGYGGGGGGRGAGGDDELFPDDDKTVGEIKAQLARIPTNIHNIIGRYAGRSVTHDEFRMHLGGPIAAI